MTTASVGTTVFVWIVFIVLLPLLPLLIAVDIVLHWSLNVPIVFPWQIDLDNDTNSGDMLLTTTTINKTDDGDVYNDNQSDYGGTVAAGADNDDAINGGGSADERRIRTTTSTTTRRARRGVYKGKQISFDEIIDVRSPSEYKWFRIDQCMNVPFDTDILSWKKTKKELEQDTTGTLAGTSIRQNQQKQQRLKEAKEHEKPKVGDDNEDDSNVFASENSKLKKSTQLHPQQKKQKNVLLVCMSGHRSPLMAYFLKRKGADQDHFNSEREKEDEYENDDIKNSSKKNNSNNSTSSVTKTTASTTTYYNLYGGMIFWKLCGKEVTYG